MGLPNVADNLWGYDQSQLLNKVDNIRYKEFYLIHGTLDDNVHYQQSMLLAKMLEQKDILFQQQVNIFVKISEKSLSILFLLYYCNAIKLNSLE
jgi:hypothetical protein